MLAIAIGFFLGLLFSLFLGFFVVFFVLFCSVVREMTVEEILKCSNPSGGTLPRKLSHPASKGRAKSSMGKNWPNPHSFSLPLIVTDGVPNACVLLSALPPNTRP